MAAITSNALVSTIESEIIRVREDLKEVDQNIKRLTGRDFTEPQRVERRVRLSFDGRDDEPPPKRRPPGGVFARLGAPVLEASRNESHSRRGLEDPSEDGEHIKKKPTISSSVARPVGDGKSRAEVAAELTKDRASRDRNRRMFGALLGTLQKFRNDEAKQKGKEEKRSAIEKKLEDKGKAEQEEMRRERIDLFKKRGEQQARIRRLNFKMARIKEHEDWEVHQRQLERFIRTSASPKIFWFPKIQNSQSSRLVSATKEAIEDELGIERLKLKEELEEILGGSMDQRNQVEHYSDADDEDVEEGELRNNGTVGKRAPPPRKHSPPTKGLGTQMDFNNSDLLDYEAEEGELVYEDDAQVLSGKIKPKPERVVVQVKRDIGVGSGGGSHRRVELVSVVTGGGHRRVEEWNPIKEEGKESSSEKENHVRKSVTAGVREKERQKSEKTHAKDKDKREKKHKRKEKENKKQERSKEEKRDRAKQKESIKKLSDIDSEADEPEGQEKDHNVIEKEPTKPIVKSPTKGDLSGKKSLKEISKVAEGHDKKPDSEEIWSEDLSHILLPLEPQPVLSDFVPGSEGANEDSQNSVISKGANDVAEMNQDSLPNADTDKKDVTEIPEPPQPAESQTPEGSPKIPDLEVLEEDNESEASRYTPPLKLRSPDEERPERRSIKSKDVSEDSTDSEDSSSDSESSHSNTSTDSSAQSESGSSSSSTFSSNSDSEEESKKHHMKLKRRRPVRPSSSNSSSDSSSDSEEDQKKRKMKPPTKRSRRSPPTMLSSKVKEEPKSDSDEKNRTKKARGRQRPDNKDKHSGSDKRERERREKEREESKRKEREKEKEKVRSREKERQQRERQRVKAERTNKRSRSRENRRERSRSRDRRREKK